jgi:four helix bundle protein
VGKVTCFEELIASQKARAYAAKVYAVSDTRPWSRDYAFCVQIRKAALSVPSNIAEGFERFNPREFLHFLKIAIASCGEVRSQLYTAFDLGYIDHATMQGLQNEALDVRRVAMKLRGSIAARLAGEAGTQHSARSTRTHV